jgi:hypothetical protein
MEDVFHHQLADEFSSDEEAVVGISRRLRAPNVNNPASKRAVLLRRVFIDSRDRDRTVYPLANDFRVSMSVPLRAVRSITLTDAFIPIVGTNRYVVVVLRMLKDRTLILPRESHGYPAGTLAVIPLVPAAAGMTDAYYRSQVGQQQGGSSIGWRITIPQGLPQIDNIHIQLFTWGWDAVAAAPTTLLYPMPADAAVGVIPIVASNISMQLEIEHDV